MLHQVVLPFAGGFSSAEELKAIALHIPGGGTRTCPRAALLSLDGSSLVSASPPFPDEQLPFGTQGRSWRLRLTP